MTAYTMLYTMVVLATVVLATVVLADKGCCLPLLLCTVDVSNLRPVEPAY